MGSKKTVISTILAVNAFVALASYYQSQLGAYIAITATVVILLLVYFRKIGVENHCWYLYTLSLALMLQASMFGVHVIGSDMHGEYYASMRVLQEGGWNVAKSYGTQSSTSVAVGALVPFLSRLGHVDPAWIYKLALPGLFALTPVVLYQAYRQAIGERYAFYAAVFFMIVPITTLEIVQIGKSMFAELFMAMAVLLIVYKAPGVFVNGKRNAATMIYVLSLCCITAMLGHYTVGIALLAYLIGIALFRQLPRLKILASKALPAAVLPVVLVVLAVSGYAYYRIADGGVIVKVMSRVVPVYGLIITGTPADMAASIYVDPSTNKKDALDSTVGYFDQQEVIVQTAIGIDFASASAAGKTFRLVQYLTQALIAVGGIALLLIYRRYRFSAEFVAGIWASYLLLAMCVFVPQFSNIINMTRFYHFALFFLAPMFVVGGMLLLRREGVMVVVILIYFVFTSGLVFELTGSTNIGTVDTPYSVGLSAERIGVVAAYTADDVEAVRWLAQYGDRDMMIVGDYNGWHLVSSYLGLGRLRENQATYNPTLDSLPDKPCYIFTSVWNNKHGCYIDSLRDVRGGAGLRGSYPMPEFDYPVVFRSGDAVIYEKR